MSTISIDNLKCIFCGEVFNDKEVFQEHFRKHGDPTFDQTSKTKQKVQNEVPTSTEKMEEHELVGCDVCEEVFPTISKAITHKHKMHPDHDAKYFCPWCGKLFTMKHLYNKHLQTNHNGLLNDSEKGFHCDSCSVHFYIPSAMLHHNKFFHRQDTDMNSIGSSKKVKLFNQELVFIFYCPFCGEEYNNKVNLHKHMEDDHEDENKTPEDVLRCPLCEAIFYHLDAYELHLTFHSSEDLYSEQNELVNEITEFSLEAVPPIMEKVEDAEIDTVNNFLETIMDASVDKVKAKKHKKHKKSKKEAITLDEFLNMNKDLFGDGLNVQGIEEVPTQMVLKKKPKGKKPPSTLEESNINAEISKLKKHGIIIKAKSNKKTPLLGVETKQLIGPKSSSSPLAKSDPNDVISKLLRQGNNQIKIVKKSVAMDSENNQDSYQSNKIDSSSDYEKSSENASQFDPKDDEDLNKSKDQTDEAEKERKMEKSEHEIRREQEEKTDKQSDCKNVEGEENIKASSGTDIVKDQTKDEDMASNVKDNTLKTLNKMGSQLTIKSLTQPNVAVREPEKITTDQSDDHGNSEFDDVNNQDNSDKTDQTKKCNDEVNEKTDEISSNPLIALNLNKRITVKTLCDKPETKVLDQEIKSVPNKSLEALRSLGRGITIKPATQSPIKSTLHTNDSSEQEMHENESDDNSKDLGNSFVPKLHESNSATVTSKLDTNTSTKSQKHADILKRLTNVTARSITVTKNIPVSSKSNAVPICSKTQIPSNQTGKEIEILNIDDSDSDADADNAVKSKPSTIHKPIHKPAPILKNTVKNAAAQPLCGSSKNVTVKSMSKQICNYTEYQSTSAGQQSKKTVINRSFESKNVNIMKSNNLSKLAEEHKNLQDTIKNLRRHITIKQKNSPQLGESHSSEEDNIDDSKHEEAEEDHDSESSVGRVKITELNENASDAEQESDEESRPRVESPHDSNNGDEGKYDDVDDELSDIESKIKATPIKTATHQNNKTAKQSKKSSNLSFLNKDITIKSLKQGQHTDETNSNFNDTPDSSSVVTNIPVKSSNNKPIINSDKQISRNVQSSQKTSTSSNQVSTVKTVKTYQSQTVIEEVTTTVTKTIRTVNTQQEVLNASQNRHIVRPQKIVNKPVNTVVGTAVRHNSPAIGTRVRNSIPASQPKINNVNIRPSNMIVPARPRLNGPRSQNSPNVRKSTPTPQNKPRFPLSTNTPVKIASNISNTSTKRPPEEPSGHFSCFKKPKESLIPHDIPNVGENETVQYSASQSSSSVTNITKIVKGNNVATTSQTKSEACSTSQKQIGKLNSMSGLKIMKASAQQKQVEEKYETNLSKNNTLAALEKLQRQGLLIKKPKLDVPETEYDNFSQSGSDEENYDE